MHITKDKTKLLARVRRLRGQLEALERQLDADSECAAVLQQIAAIRGAVHGLTTAVIEGHIREHLVEEPEVERRRQDMAPVLQILASYQK